MHDLLAQLPEEQRRLLELRLTGLTDAEIARVVGRNHGAVRASQFRAVARLRSLLGIETEREGTRRCLTTAPRWISSAATGTT